MRDHARIEELIAVRALRALDAEDDRALRREMADHGPDCAECRRLRSEYDEVAGRLAFALDPAVVRDGFEDEVIASALATRRPLEGRDGRARRRVGPPGPNLRPLVAVAASIILLAAGWALGALTSAEDVGVPDRARVVAFEGEGEGTLTLAYRPGEEGVYVLGSGLEPQPEGRVYEFWTFRGETPVRGGCFRPTPDGSVFAFLDAEVGTTQLMAVTIESSSCPSAPTTQPVFTADVAENGLAAF
jgi:hypothetical protein